MKKRMMNESMLKAGIGWLAVFVVRLIPWHAPNVEGVMATLMPFGKRFGMTGAFLYGALSIALFDLVTGKIGSWTALTAVTYGVVGIAAGWYFKSREGSRSRYLAFSLIATLFYDAITGLLTGPLFFGQPFKEALTGQIPFTLWHLLGNALFALVLSPLFYRWVVTNERLEFTLPFSAKAGA